MFDLLKAPKTVLRAILRQVGTVYYAKIVSIEESTKDISSFELATGLEVLCEKCARWECTCETKGKRTKTGG